MILLKAFSGRERIKLGSLLLITSIDTPESSDWSAFQSFYIGGRANPSSVLVEFDAYLQSSCGFDGARMGRRVGEVLAFGLPKDFDGGGSAKCGSKKEMHLRLCNHPVIIDGGNKLDAY
ncbi:unnamed protein product [Lactuca virosa]|uniref:Uncharacterized protein n=1 Tax=Lactuca virosa TaxID=75947 RepID=A0AAU9MDJ2_9ASTR|nr:unnamed protein product [Lactuca virosa]